MIYAKAHDQTVVDDYFAAMERVERRLEIVPRKEEDIGIVKVRDGWAKLIYKLESPDLEYEEGREITKQPKKCIFTNVIALLE